MMSKVHVKFLSVQLRLFVNGSVEKRLKQDNTNLVNYHVSFVASTFVTIEVQISLAQSACSEPSSLQDFDLNIQ